MQNTSVPRVGRWSGGLLVLVSAWALVGCGGGNAGEATTSGAGNASTGTPVVLSTLTPSTGGDAGGLTSADLQQASDLQKDSSGSTTTLPKNTEGRLLASNCFQCHGTNGTGGFDSIRGGEAQEIMEFLTKPASKEIMAAHAQGYTTAQLQKIIAYLQQ